MPWLDPEMTRILDYHVATHDVDLRLGTSATAVRRGEDGRLVLDLSDGTSVEADVVVMAAGARPNVDLARDAGLEIGPARRHRGRRADAHLGAGHPRGRRRGRDRSPPDRGADAVDAGRPGEPGGPDRRRHDRRPRESPTAAPRAPAVVKVFEMTAGRHRPDRDRAARRRHGLPQGLHPPERPRRLLPGHRAAVPEGAVRPGRRAGCSARQVLGWDGVDKRIDVLAVALRAGMTVFDLEHLELAYAPPYGAAKDPVNMAGFLGSNLLRGDIDLWYPEDYPGCAERVTILDVRTPAEYDAWHIPGAVLMPYTELRAAAGRGAAGQARVHVLPVGLPQLHRLLRAEAERLGRRGLPRRRDDDLPRLPPHPADRRHRAACRWSPTPRTSWPSAPARSSTSDEPRTDRRPPSWVTSGLRLR